jgi:hypothetical protein
MSTESEVIVPEQKQDVKESKNVDVEIQARDIKWRAKHKELAEENEKLKSTFSTEKSELLEKISSSEKAKADFQKKFIDAEIKAHAASAGIKDLDFIKLIDQSLIKVGDDGAIEGIDKAVEALKNSKPILFGAEKKVSSSTGEIVKAKSSPDPVDAFKLTPEQFAAERAKFGLY